MEKIATKSMTVITLNPILVKAEQSTREVNKEYLVSRGDMKYALLQFKV